MPNRFQNSKPDTKINFDKNLKKQKKNMIVFDEQTRVLCGLAYITPLGHWDRVVTRFEYRP